MAVLWVEAVARCARLQVCYRPTTVLQVARFASTKLSFTRESLANQRAGAAVAPLKLCSRCMNSSYITRYVVPSRQGLLRISTTWPQPLHCKRSLPSVGQ